MGSTFYVDTIQPYTSGGSLTLGASAMSLSGTRTTVSQTLYLPNIPTSDPSVSGQVWLSGATLKVSAG